MDRDTLLAFEAQWGREEKKILRDLSRLSTGERTLYDDLRDNRLRRNLPLEQESIGFDWDKTVLVALGTGQGGLVIK
jgi:hypothetical protein